MRLGLLFLLFMMMTLPSFSANDFYRQQIKQRIHPIGQVRVAEEAAQKEQEAPPEDETIKTVKKEPGSEIYEQYCQVCHQAGIAGAPKFRVGTEWSPRIKEKGMDKLIANAIAGINAMPPKGTCMKCTDDEIHQAVEYMVPQS